MRCRGFTLLELVTVCILVGILAAALVPIMGSSMRAYDNTLGDVIVLDKLRYATERLAREIREVKYASSSVSPTTTCTDGTTDKYCITTMGASNIVFTRPYRYDDGSVVTRDVTIDTSGTDLRLTYGDMAATPGAVRLSDELQSLALAYYDKNGTVTNSNSQVKFVQITLILRHNNNTYSQRTRVALRNQ
jgi:prepilin-type N-terminal cleavage/methylation domain-containing protein